MTDIRPSLTETNPAYPAKIQKIVVCSDNGSDLAEYATCVCFEDAVLSQSLVIVPATSVIEGEYGNRMLQHSVFPK